MANLASPQAMRSYLTGQLGYSPPQAAALLGNIQQESGFDPNNYNKGEGAYGLVQWRGDRLRGLQNYAASKGVAPSDWQTQLEYVKQEMGGPEARNASGFMSSQTLPDANATLKQYIRYGDNSEPTRLKYAQSYLGDQPQAGPSYAGLSAPAMTPGSAAPPLPPAVDVAGPAPQNNAPAGLLAGGQSNPMGGLLGNPAQLASLGVGAMNGQGLLGGLMGGEAPKAPQPYLAPPVHPRVDLSPLLQFLQARQSAPQGWSI